MFLYVIKMGFVMEQKNGIKKSANIKSGRPRMYWFQVVWVEKWFMFVFFKVIALSEFRGRENICLCRKNIDEKIVMFLKGGGGGVFIAIYEMLLELFICCRIDCTQYYYDIEIQI